MTETHPHETGSDYTPLRSLAHRQPLMVTPATTLRETLYRISQSLHDAAIIVDAATDLPLGLVTLRDMLHVISFEDGDLDDPVAAHMLGAPPNLAADAPVHRAKVMMAKKGVAHLLLTEPDGRLFGLVSQADLLGLRAGGAESLIEQPLVMSYYELPVAERERYGIPDNMIRLACGIENPEDLVDDLRQALERA